MLLSKQSSKVGASAIALSSFEGTCKCELILVGEELARACTLKTTQKQENEMKFYLHNVQERKRLGNVMSVGQSKSEVIG